MDRVATRTAQKATEVNIMSNKYKNTVSIKYYFLFTLNRLDIINDALISEVYNTITYHFAELLVNPPK